MLCCFRSSSPIPAAASREPACSLRACPTSSAASFKSELVGHARKFGRIFQVRSGPPLGADVFRIGGARFDAGLSVHSPLTLVYRVPEGFRWFRTVVGVDDSVVAPGRFALVILGDGKELVRQQFSDESRRRAIPIDLDLTGVRRITIVLDPAGGQDIGDQLDLCEARFTK